MTVEYGKFELPSKIMMDEEDKSGTFTRFIAEPFERGYGHTVGNALRRIMLTSMEAPAIVSVKIEGIPHEYMAVEGIVEDMTHIVLNLKGSLLRKIPVDSTKDSRGIRTIRNTLDITPQMLEDAKGSFSVTLKDFLGDTEYDIVNPEHTIFTVTKPMNRELIIKIAIGRGYVASERHDLENKVADEIVIDSIFTPVRLVNYFVENTRVGQDTDFDRLVLEVTTDGRITPQEALTFATQIGIHHFQVFDEFKLHPVSFDDDYGTDDTDRDELMQKLCLRINEIELSVRSTNCLQQANIENIAELVVMPESDMLRFRNFGKKSLNEIKAKLEEMNLHLGMDLSKFGINKDNVEEVVNQYLNDKIGKEV
jgi:DNA-directed RNA polymerase subunit alpha